MNMMNPTEYQLACARFKSRFRIDGIHEDILHGVIGIATEAGELLDAVKKSAAYGRPLDLVNMDEEIGDLLWYIAIYCNVRNIPMTALMHMNIAKLSKRYAERFTPEEALNRNLPGERAVLEQHGPNGDTYD